MAHRASTGVPSSSLLVMTEERDIDGHRTAIVRLLSDMRNVVHIEIESWPSTRIYHVIRTDKSESLISVIHPTSMQLAGRRFDGIVVYEGAWQENLEFRLLVLPTILPGARIIKLGSHSIARVVDM